MKIFLSHAHKDNALARELGAQLEERGFSVWISGEEIFLGDNWAKKVAKALDQAELMVILITPHSFASDSMRHDFGFAMGAEKFANRVFSVVVGSATSKEEDVPWILLRLPHRIVTSAKGFPKVVKDIEQLSHAHA